jgi:DNA-binding NarL/FixJ family response regulator
MKTRATGPSPSAGTSAKTRPILKKIRICLVDDHPLLRSGIAQRIRMEKDMSVCGQAGNAEQALATIEKSRPELVIADLSLPGQDGFHLLWEIRSRHPEIRIVVLSMHDDAQNVERAFRNGASGFVAKSSPPEKLIDAVRRVRIGEQYLCPDTRRRLALRATLPAMVPAPPDHRITRLSMREREVLKLIGQALDTAEIAARLQLSTNTVDSYRTNIKRKLGLRNTPELVIRATEYIRSLPAG